MHIVMLAWLFVMSMLAVTRETWWGGVLFFIFFAVLPLFLFLWMMTSKIRYQRAKHQEQLAFEQENLLRASASIPEDRGFPPETGV